jgi:FSR family fosmidomycin resistance protein-like MFS transporter
VAHALSDAYAAFLPPLLPRIMGDLGLSVTLGATLFSIFSLSQSLLQPLAGYLADRWGHRAFVVAGPLLGGVFLSSMGWAPDVPTLVILLVVGGLGSAAVHPPGAALAARVEEGGGSGRRLSVFSFAGAAGFASGPLVAVGLVGWLGPRGLAWAMVPALVLTPLLWRVLPAGAAGSAAVPPPGPRKVVGLLAGPLGGVFVVSALSAFVQRVFLTFMPLVTVADGGSEALGATLLTVYMAAQAAGTLAGGALTDRMERSRLLALLTALAVPAHLFAFALPAGSPFGLVAIASAGFLNMALIPPTVVMAQELVPSGAGVGSGIAMGLAWATGTLLLIPAGVLGDFLGARSAALAVVPVLLVGTLVALHPALRGRRG